MGSGKSVTAARGGALRQRDRESSPTLVGSAGDSPLVPVGAESPDTGQQHHGRRANTAPAGAYLADGFDLPSRGSSMGPRMSQGFVYRQDDSEKPLLFNDLSGRSERI
jgi:hypothetical protein